MTYIIKQIKLFDKDYDNNNNSKSYNNIENKIKYIFSSPYRSSSAGVIEISHKEIRRHDILEFNEMKMNLILIILSLMLLIYTITIFI